MSMPRFSTEDYQRLLRELLQVGYDLRPVSAMPMLQNKVVIPRDDVDIHLFGAQAMAKVEMDLGCRATYYALLTGQCNLLNLENVQILRDLINMGHEIGLHYDLRCYPDDAEESLTTTIFTTTTTFTMFTVLSTITQVVIGVLTTVTFTTSTSTATVTSATTTNTQTAWRTGLNTAFSGVAFVEPITASASGTLMTVGIYMTSPSGHIEVAIYALSIKPMISNDETSQFALGTIRQFWAIVAITVRAVTFVLQHTLQPLNPSHFSVHVLLSPQL